MALPVLVRPSLLRTERRPIEVAEGLTLAEIAFVALPHAVDREHATIRMAGEDVPRQWWHRIRPKAGTPVLITVVPSGGDALRSILQIGVTVAAMAAMAIPVVGPFVAAGILVGGMLGINALIPPVQPKLNSGGRRDSPTYSIEGAQNQKRPGAPYPVLLGFHRVTPPLIGDYVTEPAGQGNYLSMAVVWSEGAVELSDVRIGETPIGLYEGVELETETDLEQAPQLSLYPSDVHQEAVGVALTFAADWVTRTTEPDTDAIDVEIRFPQGLVGFGEKTGDRFGQSVEIEVEARPSDGGAWAPRARTRITDRTGSEVRRSIRFNTGARRQWDVRVRRITPDATDDYHRNASEWAVLRSVRYGNPFRAKGITVSALRAYSSGALQGVIQNLNAFAKTRCLDYDPATRSWVWRATNNPASLFRYVLQLCGRRKYRNDQIDIARLEYWHQFCARNGFTCNLYVDYEAPRLEILRTVAATGRAAPIRPDGRWSVIIDEPQSVPVDHITPRNSKNFQATKNYVEEYHAIRIKFADETLDYRQNERIVYCDGYSEATATKFQEIEAPGVTNPYQIWRWGRWHDAQVRLRPETYQFEMDWEHLTFTRGDLIGIHRDEILVGSGAGRILRPILRDDGLVAGYELDERIALQPGKQYALVVRRAGEWDLVRLLTTQDVPSRTLLLQDPAGQGEAMPGDLALVGVVNKVFLKAVVKSIEPMDRLWARVTAVPAAWVDESQPIPPFNSLITVPAGFRVPIIRQVRSDESVAQRDADGSLHVQAVVAIYATGAIPTTVISGITVRYRVVGSESAWRHAQGPADAVELVIQGVEVGERYEFAARYESRAGGFFPWSASVEHTVTGPALPPPDVPSAWVEGDQVLWRYDEPPPDFRGFVIRYTTAPVAANAGGSPATAAPSRVYRPGVYAAGVFASKEPPATSTPVTADATWDTALPLMDGWVTGTQLPASELPADAKAVLIKALTTAGLLSRGYAVANVANIEITERIRWHSHDLGALGYPGEITDGEIVGGVLQARDTSTWGVPADSLWGEPRDGLWAGPRWAQLRWRFTFTCPPSVIDTDRIILERELEGQFAIYYRWGNADIGYAADDEPMPDAAYERWPDDLPYGAYYDAGEGESPRPWRPWRQGARPVAGETVSFLVIGSSQERPRIKAFRVILDAQEVTEILPNVLIDAGGTRLSLRRSYRSVAWAHGTLRTGADAVAIFASDLPSAEPPTMYAETSARARTSALATITVGGY